MSATPDFTISQLTIVDGKPSGAGIRLLASFDLSIVGIVIKGCVMIENLDGVATVVGPAGKAHRGGRNISTRFDDPALARAVTRRLAHLYCEFTGRTLTDE